MTTQQTAVNNSALQQPVYVTAQVGSTPPMWQPSSAAMATQPQPAYGLHNGQPIYYLAAPASSHQAATAGPHASYCVAPHSGQIQQNQGPHPPQPQQIFAHQQQRYQDPNQHHNHYIPNNNEKEGITTAYSGGLSPAMARPFNNSAPPQLLHLQGQQSSSTYSAMPPSQNPGQWSTEATSAEPILPQQKMVYADCYYVQQPTAHFYAQQPPFFGGPVHLWQPQQQPLGSWRQKRQAFGRSDRLRRLAETLSHKDALPTFQLSDYTPHEKDNTSASETSPSQMVEGSSANNHYNRGANANKVAEANDHVFEDEEGDDVDHHNQTVSELLSMLSGSGESSNKLKPSEFAKNGDVLTSPIKQVEIPAAASSAMSLNEYIMQDKAIMKASAHLNTASTPANKAKERGGAQVPKPTTFGGSSQKKAKESPPVILAEDEATDKMVYYDKSSFMYAPKATEVPIL